ncbi:hypothetical protein KY284_005319 [Solanum tuberosum]|nr:hypothetical protein KY284_005319 [Solanum tuberosum]
MYRLNEFPYALNIWVYECASVIHNEIVVKEGNGIPRICNWKVVAAKPKFEMFMETIFTENDCSNIQPTPEEIRSLDLPDNSHVPPTQTDSLNVNHEEVQPEEVPGFEDFSSKPPEQLFRRSTRVVGTRSTSLPREERLHIYLKLMCPKSHNQMSNQISHFKLRFHNCHKPIIAGLEELKDYMKCYHIGGISTPHIVDDYIEKEKVSKEDARVEANESDTKVLSGNEDVADTIQQDFEKHASNPIIVDTSITISDDFLSNNQLPTQLPVKEPAHNLDKKTRAPRNRMPSKIMLSPYLTSFGSSDKGNEKIEDDIRPYTPFV